MGSSFRASASNLPEELGECKGDSSTLRVGKLLSPPPLTSTVDHRTILYIGELKTGQYQAPMDSELVTSARDISFMESVAAGPPRC